MNTNDIIKSLGMISPTQMPPSLIKIIHDRLEEADDIKETYQHVIREDCAPDEVHCTCVPFLRMENEKLRSENNAKIGGETRRLTCNICDAEISSPVPSATVVRAWCECPECITEKPDINDALAHLRAIVTANALYDDTAQELIDAELWLREIDATD